MSSKIDVTEIVRGHLRTLSDNGTGRLSIADAATFLGVPVILSAAGVAADLSLGSDIVSLLVNFGAIFTALLLSVLVLVYDQEAKLRVEDTLRSLKRNLLSQLYYNICYSILVSVLLVVACFVLSILVGVVTEIDLPFALGSVSLRYDVYVLTPFIILLVSNLVLTIVMVVKRMHTLLTTGVAD